MSSHAINSWCGVAFDECFDDPPCDVCAMRAENQRLRDALEGLDVPLQWIAENYPAALQAMPWEAYLAIGQAREALAGDA